MRKYNAGEIVRIAFPFEDSSEEKIRPALVIKDFGTEILVLKITSKHKGMDWDVKLPKDDFNGLAVNSVIQVDKSQRISKTKLTDIIPSGVINPIQLEIVKQKLKQYLRTK